MVSRLEIKRTEARRCLAMHSNTTSGRHSVVSHPKHRVILKQRKHPSGNLFNREEVLTRIYVKESRCTVLRLREGNDIVRVVHYGPLPPCSPPPLQFPWRLRTLMQLLDESYFEKLSKRTEVARSRKTTKDQSYEGRKEPE